jgi:predicted glycosyltransferase
MSDTVISVVIEAVRQLALRLPLRCLILCGENLLPESRLNAENAVTKHPDLFLPLRFVRDPLPYLQAADAFIGRGGYNTLADIIVCQTPSIVIPSLAHGHEQQIHANALARFGYCQVIGEAELTPRGLADQLWQILHNGRRSTLPLKTSGGQFAVRWLIKHNYRSIGVL